LALPVTLGFFTDGFTFWLGDLAMSNAMGLLADGHTLGAVIHFAGFVRAHDLAVRLLALNITDSVLGFLAGGMASRGFTHWSTDGITLGVVTLPGAFRVAFQLL